MTNFKKNKINSQILAIIDLWSYKIRVAICEFKKDEKIKLLGFAEKRQSRWDIISNKILNIENVAENIKIAIKKAEEISNIKIKEIIINSTFSQSFLESSTINFKRKDKNKKLDKTELKTILKEVEKKSINLQELRLQKKYLYKKKDLEIILNDISNIIIDNNTNTELLNSKWEKYWFFLTNVFIEKSSLEVINYISKYINKNIITIIPEEFSLTKLWEKNKDIVIIDIWNSSTYIIIKNNIWNIIWSIKLDVWIESLIEKIKENTELTRTEIIKKIDRDDFSKKEKKEFLEIYSYLIIQALKEILKDKVCPSNFFVIWWWWNNSFFKNYFKRIDFSKEWLKITNKIKYALPEIKKIANIENIEDILNKSNLNLISIILTYNFLLNKKENIVEKITKEIIKKLED